MTHCTGLRVLPGHEFWTDDISLMDRERFDTERLLTHGQVTDSNLLGLARKHQGQLATFDQMLIVDALRNGAAALHLV